MEEITEEKEEEELTKKTVVIYQRNPSGCRTETEFYDRNGNQVGLPSWFGNDYGGADY